MDSGNDPNSGSFKEMCVELMANGYYDCVGAHYRNKWVRLRKQNPSEYEEENVGTSTFINLNRDSNPHKRIGYEDIQEAMKDSANKFDLPRIVFDELWLEHKFYISDQFLKNESCLSDLI